MAHLFQEAGLFFLAAFGHLQNWLSGGGVGGAVVIATSLIEKLTGKNLSKKAHLFIFVVVFFLCSCMLAWIEEHDRVESERGNVAKLEERLKAPELRMTLGSSWWGTNKQGSLALIVSGEVINPHGPPSAVNGWRLQLEANTKKEVGTLPMLPSKDIVIPLIGTGVQSDSITLKLKDFWPTSTFQPIQAGAISDGWIMAIFREVTIKDLEKSKAKLTVECADILERKKVSASIDIGGKSGITIPGRF